MPPRATDKALAQKADATALATLDTKVTQQGKTLESQSNSLTNLSNSLSQVAADIDASGQIPGNLVVNPSFERGLDGYTGRSTATSVVEVSVPHSGTRALKVDPGNVTPGQYIPFVQGRTYEIGVWVKEPGATTDNGAGNNKLRIGNSAGQPVFERPYNSGTVGTNWTLISGRWKATETASLPVTLSNYLISGSRYFDDFYVTDVTDRVDIDATAGAVTGLTSRVSTAEGAITSQSQQLTNLQNSLNTTNSNVSKKADATALASVDNRVTEAEGKLTTQSQQLTNLANVLTATRNAGDNLIPNFDFLQGSTAWDIQYPAGVTFGDFGDGKAGVRLNRTTNTSPGIFSNNNKPVPLNGQRKYRVVVKAKGVSGAMSLLIRRQNKIGQTDSTYEDKTVTLTTDWQTITWETGLTAAGADGQNFKLYSHPTNGEIWLDSVRVFDITDETNIKATSDAVSSLTGTVTNQGNTLTSQGQSITALNNALEGVKGDVAKKADASAVSSLTNRVTQTEKDIRSQADSLTRLNTSLKQQATRGANVLPDGSFESYAVGDVLSNARAVITSEAAHSGTKSLRVTRSTEYNPNATDNNDTHIFSGMQVRDNAVYYVEAWVKLPAGSTADPTVYMVLGFSFQDSANGWSWPGLNVKVSELSVDNWTKVSGYLTNNRTALKQAMVRISIPNTDAKAAQDASDATASAVSGLTARVTDAEGKITAQAQQQTALATKVDNANSRVDNMAKTLSDSQSTQASLNTSLQSQIDAQAAANIKNQTTLDNTIKSVASITSTQQTHATALEALATQQTTLTSSVGDLSASVQNTAKTVADVNGTVSSLWSMKVETVNGKNVGAGITLGSNGETSDMILYADRFSLFNRNNATAVPVMIAEGNELYIDTARIKNSSLTSTKIADGSITNAKIGNEIRSNNFVDGSQGWRIAKDGSSQFNNVIVRGRVEANSGVFRGTVQADAFIGDIAVAKGYDSLTFRRNQTVQRNGAYQNRGYSMTVVLACTLVCQTYGTGSGLGYTSDITFNIGGQEVTRRIFVDAGNITAGTTAFELRFAARLDADYNNVGFFIKATGRNAAIDYTCTVENITATAFRTDSSSFS